MNLTSGSGSPVRVAGVAPSTSIRTFLLRVLQDIDSPSVHAIDTAFKGDGVETVGELVSYLNAGILSLSDLKSYSKQGKLTMAHTLKLSRAIEQLLMAQTGGEAGIGSTTPHRPSPVRGGAIIDDQAEADVTSQLRSLSGALQHVQDESTSQFQSLSGTLQAVLEEVRGKADGGSPSATDSASLKRSSTLLEKGFVWSSENPMRDATATVRVEPPGTRRPSDVHQNMGGARAIVPPAPPYDPHAAATAAESGSLPAGGGAYGNLALPTHHEHDASARVDTEGGEDGGAGSLQSRLGTMAMFTAAHTRSNSLLARPGVGAGAGAGGAASQKRRPPPPVRAPSRTSVTGTRETKTDEAVL
jgi:hypothetical protein